ncbi:hypothetical protein FGIG_11483 [Fasciola gigantica]|uniref:Uncharacterized protein n=1 Tax=Fasciola gigantica TaxID=46835 RepID=A0A504YC75_FASGI|nr:hypothetical protein FGIG_11483 [Fasciola gigantica]
MNALRSIGSTGFMTNAKDVTVSNCGKPSLTVLIVFQSPRLWMVKYFAAMAVSHPICRAWNKSGGFCDHLTYPTQVFAV